MKLNNNLLDTCGCNESCCGELKDIMEPDIFKALCEPNRIQIICRMSGLCRPVTVSTVAENMSVDISVVSRHLGVLRDAGILKSEKKGKEVFYTLRTKPLTAYLRTLADALEACCPDECVIDNKEA